MKTTIYPYGAPELSFLVAATTELSHYYKLPFLGTAGCTDADVIGAQMAAEVTYQIVMSVLSGADFVHDVGVMYHARVKSTELMVFDDEIIDMVRGSMIGLEINDETLPLDLIQHVGPGGDYLSQSHTLKYFPKFWVPTIFDRSFAKLEGVKNCEELVNGKTLEILKTHKPKPLAEDLVKELKKVEKTWLDRVGLKEYPKVER